MRPGTLLAVILVLLLAVTGGVVTPGGVEAAKRPGPLLLRLDQGGYVVGRPMTAWLLAQRDMRRKRFEVRDRKGRAVLRGRLEASTGRWNSRYRAVHPLDLSGITQAGDYKISLLTTPRVRSDWFHVGPASHLVDPILADTIAFFATQRDGPDVAVSALRTGASHSSDARARLYAWPTLEDGTERVVGDLVPLGGETDASGGWADAGDTVKLTHTTAFADALLWAAARELGDAAPETLIPEAAHGLAWLERMWHPEMGVLDLQVGIGTGSVDGGFVGDHDAWRRPETDYLRYAPAERYLRDRPVFRANEPGSPLPPNLAGRVSAAFALAAQVRARSDGAEAQRLLGIASDVFDAAKLQGVTQADVVTALPRAWYPESSWRDDLAWAAAELTLAGQVLGDPRTDGWLDAGLTLAIGYLEYESGSGTLEVYDTSAMALAEMVRAFRTSSDTSDDVYEQMFLDGLRAQLEPAARRAARDPFRAGIDQGAADAAPRALGLVAVERLYQGLTRDDAFEALGTSQLDWVLGANAWGTSFIIGTGDTFPRCPHHMSANLATRRDGSRPVLRGAVVSGPTDVELFEDGLGEAFDEMRTCPANRKDPYRQLTGKGARFVDDVRAWQTVEPAIDMTAVATWALALSR